MSKTNKIMVSLAIAVVIIAALIGSWQHFFTQHEGHSHQHKEHDQHKGHDHQHKGHDHQHKGHDHQHKGHDHAHEQPKQVKFSAKKQKELGITLARAQSGIFEQKTSLTGKIVIDPDRLVHITPRVPGIVMQVNKKLGERVTKGEVMAILESPELAQKKIDYLSLHKRLDLAQFDLNRSQTIAENTQRLLQLVEEAAPLKKIQKQVGGLDMGGFRSEILSKYVQYLFAKETFEREEELYKKEISSRGDFLQAESDYKKAHANYLTVQDEIAFQLRRDLLEKKRALSLARSELLTAERKLRILGLSEQDFSELQQQQKIDEKKLGIVELQAPFAGVITKKHITLGESLNEQSNPYVVADLSMVWGELSVHQKDLPLIQVGQSAAITSKTGHYQAQKDITYVSPIVEENTRTATARVVLDNSQGQWRPGLFVQALITVEQQEVPVLLPRSAIQIMDGEDVVFIKNNEHFAPRPVTIGKSNDQVVEIVSGLEQGEEYVLEGGFVLKSELLKGGFEAGHQH